MLTVLIGEHPTIIKQILDFYSKTIENFLGNILDLTYGHGKLWLLIKEEVCSPIPCLKYRVVGNDIDPESLADYHLPIPLLVQHFSDGYFDFVVLDPPYKYDSPSFSIITSKEKDEDWKPLKTRWTVGALQALARQVNLFIPRVLSNEGFLITKIMDTRLNGKLIINHDILVSTLTNFELVDQLVYLRTNTGFFNLKGHAQTGHGYYLVFKKRMIDAVASKIGDNEERS